MRTPASAIPIPPDVESVSRHAAFSHYRHAKSDSPPPLLAMTSSHPPWSGPITRLPREARHRNLDKMHEHGRGPRLLQATTPSTFLVLMALLLTCFFAQTASAVQIPFENCLPDSYRLDSGRLKDKPTPLQWQPLYVDAVFDTENPSHNLQVIVWGNVTGSYSTDPLPPANSSHWDNDDEPAGKIIREPESGPDSKATTLKSKINVLTYEPWNERSDFCADSLVNGSCPLSPIFNTTQLMIPGDLPSLPSVNMSNDFFASYSFASFSATFLIIYGDSRMTDIGCVSATITPDLGELAWLLRYLPLVVLIFVGFATTFAGIFSPWGTTDVFHWTSNYGRDADLLRLVTPGFGDCLQYIQFVALSSALTLNYPGFYQPIASQVGWTALMFNESFVSKSPPYPSIQDGIYVTEGPYGLQRYAQLIGMADVEDIWAGMMVWLLVIIAAVFVLIQIGFFFRWIYRFISKTTEEDLRAKNIPFAVGNVVRIVFNYFLLPIVALSTFQLVVASESADFAVALAVITLVILIGFAGWLLYLIVTTRPRAVLFDDLPTVLLYGPLYNTYSDEAAAFALIPVLLTIIRGIAIGAVQPFGIAQLVLLAICEVIQILTLHAFRPFHSPTSMNAYHTLFSALRFATTMLMMAFVPQMGVTEGPKGWIGYTILLIHAVVLVLGFFLNALQTIVEVAARLLGAGGDDTRGLTRGGLSKIFGMRQLQRRMSRRENGPSRQSHLSSTAMLHTDETSKSGYSMPGGRVRSESAGSGFLLSNRQRNSSALDSIDAYSAPARNFDSGASSFTPTTPGEASTFSFLPSPGTATRPQAAVTIESADPYYRPPRRRQDTLTGSVTSDKQRGSITDSRRYSQTGAQLGEPVDLESQLDKDIAPAPQPYSAISLTPRADYSTREVDFYYGVRGPALNSDGPGRKLGTGPADPTGPMASAAGWIRTMLGGKSKEKGKGFEVVRSARMPPAMRARGGEFGDETPPEGIPVAMGVLRNGPIESDDDEPKSKKIARPAQAELLDEQGDPQDSESDDVDTTRISDVPPMLPAFERGDSFKLPSRVPSKASRHQTQAKSLVPEFEVPTIPRKSSRRHSGAGLGHSPTPSFNLIPPTSPPRAQQAAYNGPASQQASFATSSSSNRLPFERSNSQKRLSSTSSIDVTDDFSQADIHLPASNERPTSYGFVPQHSISRVDPDRHRQVNFLGSAAELVDERGTSSRSSAEDRQY